MSDTLRVTIACTTCDRWEHGVKRALLDVEGVKGVTASSQMSLVGVAFDATKVTPDLIKERIESLGYSVIASG